MSRGNTDREDNVDQQSGLIQSVINSLAILEHIGAEQPVGVSRLARATGLPKSSVQRALRTLDHAGWIRSSEGDQTSWELTSLMLVLSLKAFGDFSLRDFAEPAMRGLQQRTNETVHLIALDGDSGIVIHRLDSSQAVRAYVEIGTRSPLHATASGQAILAYLPDVRIDSILSKKLPTYTDDTVTNIGELRSRLQVVHDRGYAVNVGEWRAEVASVSSPILSLAGSAIGAITISIPLSRFSSSIAEDFGLAVRDAARELGPISLPAR